MSFQTLLASRTISPYVAVALCNWDISVKRWRLCLNESPISPEFTSQYNIIFNLWLIISYFIYNHFMHYKVDSKHTGGFSNLLFLFGFFPASFLIGDPSRWPRGTLHPQKLTLTSLTRGSRSFGIVRSRTQATEFSFFHTLLKMTLAGTWALQIQCIALY
jgi:hypothetical protein